MSSDIANLESMQKMLYELACKKSTLELKLDKLLSQVTELQAEIYLIDSKGRILCAKQVEK